MNILNWLRSIAPGLHRRRNLEQLREAVSSQRTVLPVARAQLVDASAQVEKAVAAVGANFSSMAGHARQTVTEAARLLGGGEGAEVSVEGALSNSRSTLEALLERFLRDAETCGMVLTRLQRLEKDMATILKSLADVDKIAFSTTILALNAKIEAAHMGDRGQGFEIVAQEMGSLARRSEEITSVVRDTVVRLSGDSEAARSEIRDLTCANRAHIDALRSDVAQALGLLENTHTEMKASLSGAAERGENVAREIGQAIMQLQFQDRVNQQLLHVAEALEAMQAVVTPCLAALGESVEVGAAAQHLAGSYTMESERRVHASALSGGAAETPAPVSEAATAASDDGDVELF